MLWVFPLPGHPIIFVVFIFVYCSTQSFYSNKLECNYFIVEVYDVLYTYKIQLSVTVSLWIIMNQLSSTIACYYIIQLFLTFINRIMSPFLTIVPILLICKSRINCKPLHCNVIFVY